MPRNVIDDRMWAKLETMITKEKRAGRPGKNNRLFIEAVCWLIRTGAPFRDLPPSLGNWKTIYNRYSRWVKSGRFDAIFECLKKRWRSRMAHD
jgi:transposase